ncbi:Uncharacterised protein [Mycobacteroides abscessus subsp. abscessus]|nr:Uncharacterised protein [Mycobacteroides abscessus subsp. abscessus]
MPAEAVVVDALVHPGQVQIGLRPLLGLRDRDVGQFGVGHRVEVGLEGAVVVELGGDRNHPLDHPVHDPPPVLLVHAAGLVDHQHDPGPHAQRPLVQQYLGDLAFAQVEGGPLLQRERRFPGYRAHLRDRFGGSGFPRGRFVVDLHAVIGDERRESACVALAHRPDLPLRAAAVQFQRDHHGFAGEPVDPVLDQRRARVVGDGHHRRRELAEPPARVVEGQHRAHLRDVGGQLGG